LDRRKLSLNGFVAHRRVKVLGAFFDAWSASSPSLVAAGRNSSSLRIPRRKSLGEGEQGQLLRPGGKAAGGKPVQAGSHGKFPQL